MPRTRPSDEQTMSGTIRVRDGDGDFREEDAGKVLNKLNLQFEASDLKSISPAIITPSVEDEMEDEDKEVTMKDIVSKLGDVELDNEKVAAPAKAAKRHAKEPEQISADREYRSKMMTAARIRPEEIEAGRAKTNFYRMSTVDRLNALANKYRAAVDDQEVEVGEAADGRIQKPSTRARDEVLEATLFQIGNATDAYRPLHRKLLQQQSFQECRPKSLGSLAVDQKMYDPAQDFPTFDGCDHPDEDVEMDD